MAGPHAVVALNYHRVGLVDPDNPLHRLHTVPLEVFEAQLDLVQRRGRVVCLDDVRECRGLADLNYVICFDDVPVGALGGIDAALGRGLPLTLSVCGQLASQGWGERDKVYCIDKHIEPDELARFTHARLPAEALPVGDVSFYHLTKRDDLDPDLVAEALVNPLFARVEQAARRHLSAAYLSWDTLRARFASHPLVTVANHSWSHANLAALPRARLAAEIGRSHRMFAHELGRPARYFTVPFGRFSQRLAADCVEILHPLGYLGVLWVGTAANLVRGPYRSQLLQLTRLHAPATVEELAARLRELDGNRLEAAVWQVRPKAHNRPVALVESSDEQRSLQHEMIVRQGKDYASDPVFYRYQFTDNPHKGDRADYYAAECDGRIEATAYNFHTAFCLDGVTVPGVYLASWRKLPESRPAAAGMLVQRMTAREPVVGVYCPSAEAAMAFHRWNRVLVHRITLAASLAAPVWDFERRPYQTTVLDRFDDALAALCAATAGRAGFTVARPGPYQRWRHESYPLAQCRYVVLTRQDRPVAFAVVLLQAGRASIADFHAAASQHYPILIGAAAAFAGSLGAATVTLETSSARLAAYVASAFGGTRTQFENFYHLNVARLADVGVPAEAPRRWSSWRFHETQTTGDVLIR
jgi:peptidoglycan/xylan/chitin deacetylase (PgdA/CDA1 family)